MKFVLERSEFLFLIPSFKTNISSYTSWYVFLLSVVCLPLFFLLVYTPFFSGFELAEFGSCEGSPRTSSRVREIWSYFRTCTFYENSAMNHYLLVHYTNSDLHHLLSWSYCSSLSKRCWQTITMVFPLEYCSILSSYYNWSIVVNPRGW